VAQSAPFNQSASPEPSKHDGWASIGGKNVEGPFRYQEGRPTQTRSRLGLPRRPARLQR
jgi:hypothetical protein